MSQPFRLPQGGRIDRSKVLRFTWDGRALTGHAGDTLASALVANGVRVLGRSFKYHRPRGLIGAGAEECNAIVQLGRGARSTPNVRATEVALYEGLVARPVNCWPSARHDVAGVLGLFSRFLGAGFYYKTFMWPNWHFFEGAIRRSAGLGKVAAAPDPDRYETRFAHCDVLVVGAGAAGLAAARAAAAGGARVILAEQDFEAGGRLLVDPAEIDGMAGDDWVARIVADLCARPDVRVLTRTTVVGHHDHNSFTLIEQVGDEAACAANPGLPRQRTWIVRAARLVLATGAIERPLAFPGNDRPGIMLATAARHYAVRHAALPGRSAVILTNNDDAYKTALALADTGCSVRALVDMRRQAPADLAAQLASRGIPIISDGHVVATRGKALKAVRIRDGNGAEHWIDCDLLAVSGGFNPATHLISQSGGRLEWDEALASFRPAGEGQEHHVVGAANGTFGLASSLAEGHAAGCAAAATAGFPSDPAAPRTMDDRVPAPILPQWMPAAKGKAWVDFQNDVTVADIALAARENYQSVEHLKRYTTLGMAPDQGKTANVNALAIMATLTGRSIGQTGQTRHRFPYTPMALGAFAGRNRGPLYRPIREMPAQARHIAANAHLEDMGGWLRPCGYPHAGEDDLAAERREAIAVRTAAGLFEASPLGKIEVKGPDAALFLDRIYANTMSSLAPGRVRYGIMLNELGVVIDDGVAVRLAEDHFLVCTSSAGADRITGWMEEWRQCEWPDLDLILAPVTSQWGVLTLTGPKAREILARTGTDIDLADFAHMHFRAGTVAGLPARVLRVSFTGETSYEINVPARSTPMLWDRLFAAGAPLGLVPVGVDAWMVLRTEKGYLHVGGDTDGTTNALDIGWGHVLRKKSDFIGRRSLLRPADQSEDRHQFVGLASDGQAPLPIGGHIMAEGGGSEGYVTSSTYSSVLGRPVALGMLRGGTRRLGERLRVASSSGVIHTATVSAPAFYDPEGERLRD